jgi:hypothetical protein
MLHDVYAMLTVYHFTPLPPTIILQHAFFCYGIALPDVRCYSQEQKQGNDHDRDSEP